MADEWSTSLDRASSVPLGEQLQTALREAVRTGQLRAGERVPSSRSLAAELGVSRGLVQACYEQLVAEGYLDARTGSATRVAARGRAPDQLPLAHVAHPAPEIDFRYGVPDLRAFPMRDWTWAQTEAARTLPTADLGYGDPLGDPLLRAVLAAYLRRARGAAPDAEHLVICTGYQQGISLLLRAVAEQGVEAVGVEDPGDRDNDTLAARAGLRAVPVAVDEHGIEVAALDATGARAVILTPAHQAPTGVVLAPERRQALVEWARRVDGVIVEDDYDAEFRYDRAPVGSLQGLAPDRVVGIGSVSKPLAPSLRLGWLSCPAALAPLVAREKLLADRGSPTLHQRALAVLIESGRFDRHLRRMRIEYAARRAALVGAVTRLPGELRLTGLAAGFHAVLHLPPSASEDEVVAAAASRGVGLHGMSAWRANGSSSPPQLVIGFGQLNEATIERGIAAVADLLA